MSRDIFPDSRKTGRKPKRGAALMVALAAAALGLAAFAFSQPPGLTVPTPEKGWCPHGCYFEAQK